MQSMTVLYNYTTATKIVITQLRKDNKLSCVEIILSLPRLFTIRVISAGRCWASVQSPFGCLCRVPIPHSAPPPGIFYACFEKVTLQNCCIRAKNMELK